MKTGPRQSFLRIRVVRIAGAVLALLFSILLYPRLIEPRFEGKRISDWIEQYPYDNASGSDSSRALEYFGKRAAPYYIDAIRRAENWESGFFSRIPNRYVSFVADPDYRQTVRRMALRRLGELVRQEIEQNEPSPNGAFPVADRAVQLLDGRFQSLPPKTQGKYLRALQHLLPRHTNVYPLVKSVFRTVNPRVDSEWQSMLELLIAARDKTIIPDLVQHLNGSTFYPTQVAAAEALGRIAYASPEVVSALRAALEPPNRSEVRLAAAVACAHLGICPPEILAFEETMQDARKATLGNTWAKYVVVVPVLNWLSNPNNRNAVSTIKDNLAAAPWQYSRDRIQLAGILASLGSRAKPFVPELIQMLHQDGPENARAAAEALERIDPTTARIEIAKRRNAQAAKPIVRLGVQ